MKVVVLHNDVSGDTSPSDLDVLQQRDAVLAALRQLGHRAESWSCTLDLRATKQRLESARPDVVFNLVESLAGTDRLVPAATLLCEALQLPYTGVPTGALLIANGKLTTKRQLIRAQLPTAPWYAGRPARWEGLARVQPNDPAAAPGQDAVRLAPLIVKAVWEHASFAMGDDAIVTPASDAELAELLQARQRSTGQPYFAEPFIAGREFNLSVLATESGREVLPPAEIVFDDYPSDKPRIVGYQAKWDDASFEYHHTPRRFEFPPTDRALVDELVRLAAACWDEFGLRGYARVDFRVDAEGRPWILEINANPCLSLDAGFAAAVAHAGLTYEQAIDRIVRDALADSCMP